MIAMHIKSCPFCGHDASLEDLGDGKYSVGCDNTAIICMGYQSLTSFPTKTEAVKAWNMRHVKGVGVIEDEEDSGLKWKFHIVNKPRKVLNVLFENHPNFSTAEKISKEAFGASTGIDNIRINIHKIRKTLGMNGIYGISVENIKGLGWRLSQGAYEKLKKEFLENEAD